MGADDEIYEETVSRTKSDPAAGAKVTEKSKIKSTAAGTVEHETTITPEEESVSEKARDAGNSLRELVFSVGRKTRQVTEEKARELKARSEDIGATSDARDIQKLGDDVDRVLSVFEETMTEIRKEAYDEQHELLKGYKKLLEEQINVINARMEMVRRLKPGA